MDKFDIKERRLELGLTLEQVGKMVGVSKSTVRKWETGYIANMKRDKIALLAKALKVTPSEFMGWEEPTTTPKEGYFKRNTGYYKGDKWSPLPFAGIEYDTVPGEEPLADDEVKLIETYKRAKESNDPVLKALVDAIDKHIAENAHKDD